MKAKVHFTEVVIQSQKTHPSDLTESHLFANVPFTIECGGKTHKASVTIRQPFGTAVEETIETQEQLGSYKGNWDHNQFHDVVEKYWRLAEQRARITLGIPANAKNFAKERVRILLTQSYDIAIPD